MTASRGAGGPAAGAAPADAADPTRALSESMMWSLVRSSEDVVRVLDTDGCITFVNPKALTILGLADAACLRGAYWPDLLP